MDNAKGRLKTGTANLAKICRRHSRTGGGNRKFEAAAALKYSRNAKGMQKGDIKLKYSLTN